MSVLVTKNGEYVAFVKGSPEKIAELCDPGSLPENYLEILKEYTK